MSRKSWGSKIGPISSNQLVLALTLGWGTGESARQWTGASFDFEWGRLLKRMVNEAHKSLLSLSLSLRL